MTTEPTKLFVDVKQVIASKNPAAAKKIPNFVFKALSKIICQDDINKFLSYYGDTHGVDFAENILKFKNVDYKIHGNEKINPDGRYIIVSNHPLGGLDGLILITHFGRMFPSIKFVVNDLLMFLKPLADIFVPVNKHGKQGRERTELLNNAYESDAQILYFPAGLCSRLIKGKVTDLEWKKSFVKKAVESNRDIVPIFFSGENSRFFYRLAKIRKFLGIKFNIEMLFLPRELFKRKDYGFDVYIGDPIPVETINKDKSWSEWTQIIREKVYNGTNNQPDR